MRTIEDIITGELVRLPRKLKKKIRKITPLATVCGYDSISRYLYIRPGYAWIPVKQWEVM